MNKTLQKKKQKAMLFGRFSSTVVLPTSFQSISCAADSTAHMQQTVQQPEKQTPQSSQDHHRWRPSLS